jgi:tetratricopeptide (TPR) repeat protein
MAAALADLSWNKDRNRATAYARRALKEPDLSAEARVTALLTLAGSDMQDGEFESASRRLEQLVRLRRAADDWYCLGECYLGQGQPSRALPALEQALAIRPDKADVHVWLAKVYRRLGDLRLADEHREKARGLSVYPQD